MFEYSAKVARVIDGDTYVLDIDLGFSVFTRQSIRLRGIDCPPLGTPAGYNAKDFVEQVLFQEDNKSTPLPLIVRTTKRDGERSFERYVADVVLPNGRDLREVLILGGYGKPIAG